MSHIVFFSYARENLDPYLQDFFKDLCSEIAPDTQWAPEDERISFQDKNNLRLMENWKTHIESALQSTAVMVCITSVAYLNKEFCGKEYYVFDQRRRQGIAPGQDPPSVILPVIWAPVPGGLPEYMNDVQQVPKDVSDSYRGKGLRHLKRFDLQAYEKCVTGFAKSITDAWRKYDKKIKPLAGINPFTEIPNRFADGEWQEAANQQGWIEGPEVANFVFAAPSSEDFPDPPGRYGTTAAEWRPYLPGELSTILEHAKKAAKSQSLKFREIRANTEEEFSAEVAGTRERKNLSILLAEPRALPLESFKRVRVMEKHWWDGTAIILPCTDEDECKKGLKIAFPLISQTSSPKVQGPIRTSKDLDLALELMLTELRTAVTHAETEKKKPVDAPPPGVTSAGSAQP